MKKGVLFLSIFLIAYIGFIFINVFIESRQEYLKKYDFIIDYIETDAKGDLIFCDSLDNKYSFTSYRFNKYKKLRISVEDRIFKDHYSKNMFISRRIKNEYKIYHIQTPNGMIPFSFYSN